MIRKCLLTACLLLPFMAISGAANAGYSYQHRSNESWTSSLSEGLRHGAHGATSAGSAARQQQSIARQDFKVLHISRRAEVWLVGMPIHASRRAPFGARTATASFAPRADAAKQQRSPISDHGAVRETGDRPSVSFEIIAVARIDESKRKRPCGTGCA
jgi:hypothetical protein